MTSSLTSCLLLRRCWVKSVPYAVGIMYIDVCDYVEQALTRGSSGSVVQEIANEE